LKAGSAALAATAVAWNAKSYAQIAGANDRVRVGIVGCGDRMKGGDLPAFQQSAKDMNFQIVAVSDIWKMRREQARLSLRSSAEIVPTPVRNNDELYARKDVDAVIIATADFQHAYHGAEAVEAGRDAYVEKPTAHTMADARRILAR
jgi:predicted dehydrogenase